MERGDRVRHKSGVKGKVVRVTDEWIYVTPDGMSTAIPYKAEWLEVIDEEGEHGQEQGN